jgi:Cof subfamily protein (haloacid dehalogenase superfamily)
MTIKLIALDLDGTTLNSKGRLTERTRNVLEKAISKGINVVVATGRCYSALPEEIVRICGIQYALTSNGAQIKDLRSGETLMNNCMDPFSVEESADVLRRYDYMTEVFTEGKAYIEKKNYDEIAGGGITYRYRDYVLRTRNPVEDAMGFMIEHKHAIENINIFFDDQEDKKRMWHVLSEISNVTVTSSLDNNWELGGANTSKAAALEELCRVLDVHKKEIMACGDSLNDKDMLMEAGIPVAVGNAKDVIKEIASYITGTNNEDGVAEAIEKFAL